MQKFFKIELYSCSVYVLLLISKIIDEFIVIDSL